ncbi:hypothetical protein MTO96_016236 [Rhipicephalus appendiculatus]
MPSTLTPLTGLELLATAPVLPSIQVCKSIPKAAYKTGKKPISAKQYFGHQSCPCTGTFWDCNRFTTARDLWKLIQPPGSLSQIRQRRNVPDSGNQRMVGAETAGRMLHGACVP